MFKEQFKGSKLFWDGRDLGLIIIITVIITAVTNHLLTKLPVELLEMLPLVKQYRPLIINLVQFMTMFVSSVYIIVVKYKLSLWSIGLRLNNWQRIITLGISGGIGICSMVLLINLGIQKLIMELWQITLPSQPIIDRLMSTQSQLIFLGYSLLIVIVAPVTEEIFFRGLLYQYFKARLGLLSGSFLTAGIFALFHFNLWTFLATFVGGLGLIMLYELSQSLYTAVLAHITWNLIIVTIIYLIWQSKEIVY
ncbi:MAG: CPBP family intramembrane glutamic endopeptidase [Bacillota bacterium]